MNSITNNSTEDSDDVINRDEQIDNIETSKTKRRRKRNVSEWNREKRKRLRIAGKEYVNTKGELIRPRKIGADCECRRKCYAKVNVSERERLFDNYYSLLSHDEQNAHLFELIRKQEIARRRSKGSEKRTCTFKYFVNLINGKEIHICRQAFCHIHAISAHKVRLLCEKLDRNVSYPRDERGRHNNRPTRIPDNIISAIKKHVIVTLQSGNERLLDFIKDDKQAKNQTGADLINITKMWRDFLNEQGNRSSINNDRDGDGDEEEEVEIEDEWSGASVKLWLYNKVFHSVVSRDMSDLLSKKIEGFKSVRGQKTKRRSDGRLISASENKEVVSLPRNLILDTRTGLDSSQTEMPVYSSDQSSFLFCGVINNAQYYR